MVAHECRLPLDGCYNFRDLGGINTIDGRSIIWGKVFRSDDLCNLTPKDQEYLRNIPLISIVDFRSLDEVKVAPDIIPASVKEYYGLCLSSGNLAEIQKSIATITPEQLLVSPTRCKSGADEEYVFTIT